MPRFLYWYLELFSYLGAGAPDDPGGDFDMAVWIDADDEQQARAWGKRVLDSYVCERFSRSGTPMDTSRMHGYIQTRPNVLKQFQNAEVPGCKVGEIPRWPEPWKDRRASGTPRMASAHEFRLTKYDPAKRDPSGAYMVDEWTSRSDIGHTFAGVVLSETEYQRVEDAYVSSVIAFIRESGAQQLQIAQLENHKNHREPRIELRNGAVLDVEAIGRFCRLNLREVIWCKLEDDAGRYVHFGYDYYAYIGMPTACEGAQSHARDVGLFVEPIRSPYLDTEG